MRDVPVVLSIALVLTQASCTREAVPPPATDPATAAEAPAAQPSGRTMVFIALGALVLVVLVAAAAGGDDYLDYSEICGTPDCS